VSGNTSPNIIGNTLIYNSARAGGGIRVGSSCSAFIMDNFINRNYAVVKGGGIECWNVCSPIIRCNTITDNSGYYGSGIHCDWGSTPIIDSCIISDNRNGHGIWCEDGANPVIRHNNITDNEGDALHNTYFLIHINADSNWWGHSTGPYHPIANPGGLGDTVSNHVDFDPWVTEPFSWGIEEYEVAEPIVITLQISPNPFRDKVNIKCSKEYNTGALAFTIYDATGRAVHEFNDLNSSVFSWNATDNFNRRLSSGVYILKVEGGDYCATEKLLLIR
jgi:parallel beta-helix repeat protein